ncbi:DUF4399 domain-containing protein [Marinobacter zhejiangensis]|nr:DUF4399 domain-containing protein [Marinobacter zhejiangensis]
MIKILGITTLLTLPLTISAAPPPEGASTRIISPADGDTVSSPVTVVFGLTGLGVAPAGTDKENTGHHHLLVDVEELPPAGEPIPSDDHHRHFGGGQTEASLDLAPGEHTLQLIFGDKNHTPHTPPVMSEKITITVE